MVFVEKDLWTMLLGDRTSGQYDSLSGKMVLRQPFASETREALALYIHCLGLQET